MKIFVVLDFVHLCSKMLFGVLECCQNKLEAGDGNTNVPRDTCHDKLYKTVITVIYYNEP